MINKEKQKYTKNENNKKENKQLLIPAIIVIILGICAGVLMGWVISSVKQSTKKENQNINTTTIKTKIPIGVIIPLTGNYAPDGRNIQQITQLVEEEINAHNGIANKPIQFIYEDGQCSKEKAEKAAKKLIQKNKIELLYAGICAEEIEGSVPIAQTKNIITFTSRATNDLITNQNKYLFSTAISQKQEGKIAAWFARTHLKSTKISLLYEDREYAKQLSEIFKDELIKLKGKIVLEQKYKSKQTEFNAIAQKIKEVEPDLIYLIPESRIPAILAIKALQKNKVNTTILTNMQLLAQEEITKHSKILNETIGMQKYIDTTSENYKKLHQKFIEKFGHEPSYPVDVNDIYNFIALYKSAYEKAIPPNTEQIAGYLQNQKEDNGVANQVTFNHNEDNRLKKYGIYKIINNKIELMTTLESQ